MIIIVIIYTQVACLENEIIKYFFIIHPNKYERTLKYFVNKGGQKQMLIIGWTKTNVDYWVDKNKY